MPVNAAIIIAVLSAIVAVGTLVHNVWASRGQPGKDRAETAQLITEAASDAVVILRGQIADLKARIILLEASLKVHTEEIARLRTQIRILEIENQRLASENVELRDRWNLST